MPNTSNSDGGTSNMKRTVLKLTLVTDSILRDVSLVSTDRDFLRLKNDFVGSESCIESNAFAINLTDGWPPLANSSRRILYKIFVPVVYKFL